MTGTTEDVLRLVCGVTTATELAVKYGVTEAEVERWRTQHLRAIERLANPPRSRRPAAWALAFAACAAACVGLYSTEAFAQACPQTLPGTMKTFCPDAPAIAAEVNANNQALVNFIQQKVGTVGNANISTAGTLNTGAATVSSLSSTGAASVSGNLTVGGNAFFGSQTRQHLNLWGTQYGVGVQNSTLYFRGDTFAWHGGGSHSDTVWDPGAGGTRLMTLDAAGNLAIPGQLQAGSLRHRGCAWGNTGPATNADGQYHEVYCPTGTFAAGWRCYANTYIDGACQMLCCNP